MFNDFIKLRKMATKKIRCNRFRFISVGVWTLLRFLVSIKNFRQHKKFAMRQSCEEIRTFHRILCSMQIISDYQCLFTLTMLFDEVDRVLGHEKKIVRYHLFILFLKTVTNNLN